MTLEEVEGRLSILEAEVAKLRQQIGRPATHGHWIYGILGSMKDEPEFEEIFRLGRQIRRSDAPS